MMLEQTQEGGTDPADGRLDALAAMLMDDTDRGAIGNHNQPAAVPADTAGA